MRLVLTVVLTYLAVPPVSAQRMFTSGAPIYGTLRPTTTVADTRAIRFRGSTQISSVLAEAGCLGYVNPSAPDAVVEWGGGDLTLWVTTEVVLDPTLAVYGPDGRWRCNDDSDGLLPKVEIVRAPAGRYAVWVGKYSAEPTSVSATLYARGGMTLAPQLQPPGQFQFEAPSDRNRWHVIAEYPTLGVYLDKETFQRTASRVTAWIWHGDNEEATTRSTLVRYDRTLARYEFDCSRQRTRSLEEIFYRQGDVVSSESYDPPTTWTAWAPGTDGESIGRAACAYRRR